MLTIYNNSPWRRLTLPVLGKLEHIRQILGEGMARGMLEGSTHRRQQGWNRPVERGGAGGRGRVTVVHQLRRKGGVGRLKCFLSPS